MIRKKKMRKLGLLKPAPVAKTSEQKKYEALLKEVNDSLSAKAKNKKFKVAKSKEWNEEYSKIFPKTQLEAKEDWAKGSTSKKNVFEPANLKDVDLDEVNQKRKANNINTPIEQANVHAALEAQDKAKRVAIVCHKSGYQYIGEGKDSKSFGKKSNQLE